MSKEAKAKPPLPPAASRRVPPAAGSDRLGDGPLPGAPAKGGGAELGSDLSNYQAGRGRRLQLTSRGRGRFGERKRQIFLEWFAATCNASLAAKRAGVHYRTPGRTRMRDARFAEGWDRAVDQGYARLEAKMLEMQYEQASGEAIDFDGGFDPDADAPDPPLVDPTMAMQLLRQHKAEVMKIRAARGVAAGRSPLACGSDRLASDAEVRRALVKALRAFGVRVAKEDLKGTGPHPGPLPQAGEGEL